MDALHAQLRWLVWRRVLLVLLLLFCSLILQRELFLNEPRIATSQSSMREYLFPSTYLSKDDLYWKAAHHLPCMSYVYGSRPFPFREGPMDPPLHNVSLCDNSWNSEAARIEAHEFLMRNQFGCNCSKVRIAVVGPFATSGIGSSLHLLLGAVNAALCDNRTVVYAAHGAWFWADCPLNNPDCYFEPISSCTAQPADSDRVKHYAAHIRQTNEKCVPQQFASRPYNWWRAQLMQFLLRPQERVKQIAIKVALETFNQVVPKRPVLSVFVRRADKLREMSRFYNISEYFDSWAALKHLPKRYQPQSIYLNSEDPVVIPEARTYAGDRLYVPTIERGYPSFRSGKQWNISQQMLGSLADLYVLAAADFHAGTLTSNWCRLVDELRLARGKSGTPYFTPEQPIDRYLDS